LEVADPPLPPLSGVEPPAVEVIWELMIDLLKGLSTIFNALEAAESAKTRGPVPTGDIMKDATVPACAADDVGQTIPRSTSRGLEAAGRKGIRHTRRGRTSDKEADLKVRMDNLREQLKVLRKKTREDAQDDDRGDEISQHDIEHELQELKKRGHAEQLETMLRDYVRLDFVRKREADWWCHAGVSSAAYKEAIDAGSGATWNPAPAACSPLRLRIRMSAGTPWQVVRAASFRGVSYDVIDARTMLCSEVGLLGICTWFDSVLKSTPHAYIQTRHCEELFVDRLRTSMQGGIGSVQQAGAPPANSVMKAHPRSPAVLAAAGSIGQTPTLPLRTMFHSQEFDDQCKQPAA